ncbi:MAG: peptide chain release factor N(5)-glutamine methyltransferase [Burkholderiaceae bacterium]
MKTPSAVPMSVAQALQDAQASGLSRLDAQLLLAHVLSCNRTWLTAHADRHLSAAHATTWAELSHRAIGGEPLAYILGEKEFHGLTLHVTPDVLIPRADTETLVDWALERLQELPATIAPHVIDLGCGSGAIALAVKHRFSSAQVSAVDASTAALAVAQRNGARLGLAVQWQQSDWWSALEGQRFHLALSNPPYIADDDPHLSNLTHEPRQALTAGSTGLDDLHQLVDQAPLHLHSNGWLLLEHGFDQAASVRERLLGRGFSRVSSRRDLAGHERCSGGCWVGTPHP